VLLAIPVGLDKWAWPEGFVQPVELTDPVKAALFQKVKTEIDKISTSLNINYHSRAKRTHMELDNVMVLRYLVGSQWIDPPDAPWKPAAERILETIDWRVSAPLPVVDRALMNKELVTGKFVVNGLSKNGRPVLYIRIGRENTWDPRGNLMSMVYSMERAIGMMECNTSEMIAIVDCAGVGMMNAPSTAFLKLAIEVMGKHYPRRNGQVFIVNVSSVFYMVWNIISLTLSEIAKKKIQILTSDTAEMRAAIGNAILHSLFIYLPICLSASLSIYIIIYLICYVLTVNSNG
jgi:hypothetical protein